MKKLLCSFITLSCVTQTTLAMDSELEHLYSDFFKQAKHTIKKAMEATGLTEELLEEDRKNFYQESAYRIH